MNVGLFRAATDYARDVTSGLTSDALGLPTPCEGWDTGTVVLHLADVAAALVGLIETGELKMPASPGTDASDPVALFHGCLDELLDTLSTAENAERAHAAMQAGTIELTTHGWDIAVASDRSHRIPEHLAGDVLGLATSLISDHERGTKFGARIDASATVPMSDRLTAFLGRRPGGPGVRRRP